MEHEIFSVAASSKMMVLIVICGVETTVLGVSDPLLLSPLPCFNLTKYCMKYHRE